MQSLETRTYSPLGLIWSCGWLLAILLVELVASIPLASLFLLWRLVLALRIEQQLIVAGLMALVIATTYSLSISLVLGLLLLGLTVITLQFKIRQESNGVALFTSISLGLVIGLIAGIRPTSALYAGLVFSAVCIIYMLGVLRLPRFGRRGMYS